MIVLKDSSIKEKEFVLLLEKTKDSLLQKLKTESFISFSEFEAMVCRQIIEEAKGSHFEDSIEQTSQYAFPDIIAKNYYGIEVKHTTKDHWRSTGNSILESNRAEGVERIYMFFGKFGGDIDIIFRLYQECLTDVSVTHSPRYRINMLNPLGESIFDKMGTDYNDLRLRGNTIKEVQEYYKSQLKDGEDLWWIDTDAEHETSPIIRPFSNMDKVHKDNFIAECFILFPEIFDEKNNHKYERAAAYLVSHYGIVSSSLRDSFTAGGKFDIIVNDNGYRLPQIYKKLILLNKIITHKMDTLGSLTLSHYWKCEVSKSDRMQSWLSLIDERSHNLQGIKPSKIFKDCI